MTQKNPYEVIAGKCGFKGCKCQIKDKSKDHIDLLPCVGCGGNEMDYKKGISGMPILEELSQDFGGGFRVSCYTCAIMTFSFINENEAVLTWNKLWSRK